MLINNQLKSDGYELKKIIDYWKTFYSNVCFNLIVHISIIF